MRYTPDANELAALLTGTWDESPPVGWSASRLESARAVVKADRAEQGTLVYATGSGRSLKRLDRVRGARERIAILAEGDQEVPASSFPVLRVEDVADSLRVLSGTARDRFGGSVIAVTGSAGKTTTRSMLRHVLSPQFSIHEGGANYTTALRSRAFQLDDAEIGLFEVASIGLPTVEKFVRPNIAIVTSIGEAHMDVLETLEGVAATKAILFEGLEEDGTAIINLDTPHSAVLVARAEAHASHVITYGESSRADIRLQDYDYSTGTVTAEFRGDELEYVVSLAGKHNALNSLAVIGALSALGLDPHDFVESFRTLEPVGGRGDVSEMRLGNRRVTVVDQSYNANPTSMKAALESFGQKYRNERRIVVLGDMLELGDSAEDLHRGIVDAILEAEPAKVFLVGRLMETVWPHLPKSVRVMLSLDARPVEAVLPDHLEDGDAVFVKASNGAGLADMVRRWRNGQEHEEVSWKVLLSGDVQGVGFRQWTKALGRELRVDGWVRNRSDGRVETLFRAKPSQMSRFLGELHKGPPGAVVTGVTSSTVETVPHSGFRVRKTYEVVDVQRSKATPAAMAKRTAKRIVRSVRAVRR